MGIYFFGKVIPGTMNFIRMGKSFTAVEMAQGPKALITSSLTTHEQKIPFVAKYKFV